MLQGRLNPDGTIQCYFIVSVRPEPFCFAQESPVEGLVLTELVVRQAHHERPNGLSREALIEPPVRPELVEGLVVSIDDIDLIRSWFDKLTTNGLNKLTTNGFNQCFPKLK